MPKESITDKRTVDRLCNRIQKVLSPDLLKPMWAKLVEEGDPAAKGHCYAATEALFYMVGGKEAGWVPHCLSHANWPEELAEGETHWFLKHKEKGIIADPTQDQFEGVEIPYERGRGNGFLTKEPSHRARVIMERVEALEASKLRAAS